MTLPYALARVGTTIRSSPSPTARSSDTCDSNLHALIMILRIEFGVLRTQQSDLAVHAYQSPLADEIPEPRTNR
jgi:hypothetical protein